MNLNDQQETAASFHTGICSVNAIPGSGKTLCMTTRIAMLINKHGVAPENILGLTFTRSAAQTMRDRLATVLNEETASRVTLSTIHSFCLTLLRNEGKTFEVLSGKEQIIFLRKLIHRSRVRDLSTGMVLREIALAKANLISFSEFLELFDGDKTLAKIGKVYAAYEREKAENLLLDFDDFLLETHALLTKYKKIRRRYQSAYPHLLYDEYQDTTPAQVEVLKLLISEKTLEGKGGSFSVFADDWQGIFSFAGSSISNIINFKKIFPGAKEFILNLNYRSTPQIIRACQNLIQHNERKVEKVLGTENPDGDDVVVLNCSSEEDEALHLVNEIADMTGRRGYDHKDIAILYRANFQSRCVEEFFIEHKIPYHIENGLNFYQRWEVKALLDYLRFIDEPNSDEGDEALRSIINCPNRYIGRAFVRDLETFSLDREKHLYQGLKAMKIEIPYIRKNVRAFIKFMDPLIKDARKLKPAQLLDILRDSLDYDRYITDDEVPSPDDTKIENLDQLKLAAARYSDIGSFLHYTETFREETANDKDGVSLMTIHKSKGVEFRAVFVIGLVDGILPTKKGDKEEERRVTFVGISRARELLYLSHYCTRGGQPAQRSIFVDEILGDDERK